MGRAGNSAEDFSFGDVVRHGIADGSDIEDSLATSALRRGRTQLVSLTETLADARQGWPQEFDSQLLATALSEPQLALEKERFLAFLISELLGADPSEHEGIETGSEVGNICIPVAQSAMRREMERFSITEQSTHVVRPLGSSACHLRASATDRKTLCEIDMDEDTYSEQESHGSFNLSSHRCVMCRDVAFAYPADSPVRKAATDRPWSPAVTREQQEAINTALSGLLEAELRMGDEIRFIDLRSSLKQGLRNQTAALAAAHYSTLKPTERLRKLCAIDPHPEKRDTVVQIAQLLEQAVASCKPFLWPFADDLAKTFARPGNTSELRLQRIQVAAHVVQDHFPSAIPAFRELVKDFDVDTRLYVLDELEREDD